MEDDEYKFEESDDPRTWGYSDELVPDCEHPPVTAETYWRDFAQLVDACGRVAYHWKMARNCAAKEANSAKRVAEEYHRNLLYYRRSKKECVFEAKRLFSIWQLDVHTLGVEFHLDDEKKRAFLNSLALDSDKRKCARSTIKYARSKGLLLSFEEIEGRFEKHLERVQKRQNKDPF